MPSPAKIWEQALQALHARLAPLFHYTGPRQRSFAYLRGLLSDVERKNSWQLAEWDVLGIGLWGSVARFT